MQPNISTRAYSAPSDARQLPKLKVPAAPSLCPSPSPFDPPTFQLPGSPSLTTRRLEEKVLSRSAPSRLRRLGPVDIPEGQNRPDLLSPASSETSSNTTPTGSPTLYSLLRRGQTPGQTPRNEAGKLGFQKSGHSETQESSPRGSDDRVKTRHGTGVRRPESSSSHQKVEFGSALLPQEQIRGIQPEKSQLSSNENNELARKFSLGDLQFQMEELQVSKKEIEDKRKEGDEMDFLDLEF